MRRLEKQRIFSYKYKICSIESDSNNKHKRFNASLMIQSFAWRNRLFSYIHIDCTDDRMNRFRRCWLSKIRKKIWNCSIWRRNSRSYTVICKKKFTWNRCKVSKIQKESEGACRLRRNLYSPKQSLRYCNAKFVYFLKTFDLHTNRKWSLRVLRKKRNEGVNRIFSTLC